MPRHARQLLPGYPVHLIQRGHNQQPCFLQRSDYFVYLDKLREAADFYGAQVHAYVLMTNHVHVLASLIDMDELSAFMKCVGQNYAQYLNRRLERSGAVWRGRFHSSPITNDRYFLACQRYIELNPVRAKMVESPGGYRWSSYAGNAGLLEDRVVTPHSTYLGLSTQTARRYAAYRDLFADAIDPAVLAAIRRAAAKSCPIACV
ncbi:putative transposase [Pseudoduganella flava]|uniref:Transposase n=1 Tax=Pseudoduganella flava TaxID=871742 RepID=A0A562PEK1_9BURK|nr:transposase [Pseudoduganella flava]QGZ38857.1 transposase [Pseudoduganella flava]TWI42922.1 putative transposase [Pseudoduganella flava]